MLYSDLIRERFRAPRHRGRLPAPDASHEDVNPLCGDRIRMECRLAGGRLADARFSGDSCAIAQATADVLLDLAVGEPREFVGGVTVEALAERLGGRIRPSRLQCVALPLSVLRSALGGGRG